MTLRECPMPEEMQLVDTPDKVVAYWNTHIPSHPLFNSEVECFVVLLVNTRRRVKGHHFVSMGTMETVLVHSREVFRVAVIAAAAAVVLIHNHPSGEPSPSEADIRVTRDLMRAGEILRVEVLDHVIIGRGRHASLRELGYLYA